MKTNRRPCSASSDCGTARKSTFDSGDSRPRPVNTSHSASSALHSRNPYCTAVFSTVPRNQFFSLFYISPSCSFVAFVCFVVPSSGSITASSPRMLTSASHHDSRSERLLWGNKLVAGLGSPLPAFTVFTFVVLPFTIFTPKKSRQHSHILFCATPRAINTNQHKSAPACTHTFQHLTHQPSTTYQERTYKTHRIISTITLAEHPSASPSVPVSIRPSFLGRSNVATSLRHPVAPARLSLPPKFQCL